MNVILFQVVQLLLNRGALLHRDHNGRTPFHLAAMCGYSHTMDLLFSFHSHMLDQVDKDGVSPSCTWELAILIPYVISTY